MPGNAKVHCTLPNKLFGLKTIALNKPQYDNSKAWYVDKSNNLSWISWYKQLALICGSNVLPCLGHQWDLYPSVCEGKQMSQWALHW